MRIPRIAFLLALILATVVPGGARAVELPQNRPTDDTAALEQRLQQQRDLPSGRIQGFVHIPDQKEGVLVQPQGRDFRDFRTRWQPWIDAVLIVVAVFAMIGLYLIAGPMRYTKDRQGRTIQRFTGFERFIHWGTAVSFIWLAVTGLNLVFGRWLLEPLIGDNAFSSFSALAKVSHNSVAFAFMLLLVVMAIQWLRHNLPSRLDLEWIKAAGGMFGGPHPPARKFNAGQKMIYWIAVFGGGAISLTGIALLAPFYVLDIGGMQLMQVLHSIVAALMMAVIIGHIYLGSVGVQGSFQAMTTGRVDVNWAREHHALWLEEETKQKGVSTSASPLRAAE